jgi:hypothetical protein
MLQRQVSDSEDVVASLVARFPPAPLFNAGVLSLQGISKDLPTVPNLCMRLADGMADHAEVAGLRDTRSDPFLESLPPHITLLKESIDHGVIVAQSLHLPAQNGVYPTKDFLRGDVIFYLRTPRGWMNRTDAGNFDSRYTVQAGPTHVAEPRLT